LPPEPFLHSGNPNFGTALLCGCWQFYCDIPPCKVEQDAVAIFNVAFVDIRATIAKPKRSITLNCSDSVPCSKITLKNINIMPSYELAAKHAHYVAPLIRSAYGTMQDARDPYSGGPRSHLLGYLAASTGTPSADKQHSAGELPLWKALNGAWRKLQMESSASHIPKEEEAESTSAQSGVKLNSAREPKTSLSFCVLLCADQRLTSTETSLGWQR